MIMSYFLSCAYSEVDNINIRNDKASNPNILIVAFIILIFCKYNEFGSELNFILLPVAVHEIIGLPVKNIQQLEEIRDYRNPFFRDATELQ